MRMETIRLEELPGTVLGSSGLILPVNNSTGEIQFNGDGVKITGLTGGSASLCFNTYSSNSEWVSVIYHWSGEKWEKMDTSLTDYAESSVAKACSTIYSDGTYALLISYTSKEVSIKPCKDILFIYPYLGDPEEGDLPDNFFYIEGGVVYPGLPVGTHVSYHLRNISPKGSLTGSLSASGIVTNNVNLGTPDDFYSEVVFPPNTTIYYSEDWRDITFTVRFFTQGCYFDFKYPDDLESFQ